MMRLDDLMAERVGRGGRFRAQPMQQHQMPMAGYEQPQPLLSMLGGQQLAGLRRRPRAGNQRMAPQAPGYGYDSSGINPHGIYNGTFGQPSQFPQNPGGFQPMGGLQGMFNRFRGG